MLLILCRDWEELCRPRCPDIRPSGHPTTDGNFRELRFGTREGERFNMNQAVAGPRLLITTDEQHTPVPEPTSISGLLALAAVGGLQLKRKQQQKVENRNLRAEAFVE